jgi:hypothetical protein
MVCVVVHGVVFEGIFVDVVVVIELVLVACNVLLY